MVSRVVIDVLDYIGRKRRYQVTGLMLSARGKSRGLVSKQVMRALREWKDFCDEQSQKEGVYLLCISRHSHHPR
jgi:hypothetical protein